MKKICKNCQYWREQGWMDFGIPGIGNWCSNSQWIFFRQRTGEDDTCPVFVQKGKKAPWWMRVVSKVLAKINDR